MVGCFKYVQKYKRLVLKTLQRMTAFLLNESQDLSSFYSAEGELQNYLQAKIKKIHSAGKFLTKETNKKVKELLDLNLIVIEKLEKISQKENKEWNLKSEIRERGPTANLYLSKNKKDDKDVQNDQTGESMMHSKTSDFLENNSLKQFLENTVKDSSSGIQKTLKQLERCYAQLVSIFVVFPKIIKNIQGLFEDKKEKSKYFETKKKRKSRGLVFWKNPYNQKNSYSYIQNIFQKLLGSFSKSLISARKVLFQTDLVDSQARELRVTLSKKNSMKVRSESNK
jgi:hypothetical protein